MSNHTICFLLPIDRIDNGHAAVKHDFQRDIDAVARIDAIPKVLDVVCQITGMRFAAVARVTAERWVCLAATDQIAFGLTPGGELKVETTICQEVRECSQAVVIDHVAEDDAFRNHATPAMYGFQSYISMPIFLKDGSFYGTLCAIDPAPRKINNDGIVGMFKLFAELIGEQVETHLRLESAESELVDAHEAAVLREQFIAVLGHDLRNPLASIGAGVELLRKRATDDQALTIVELMRQSVRRMTSITNDVLDFARGRLGGGVALKLTAAPLEPCLRQVIEELQLIHPDRTVETSFHIQEMVTADRDRIGQLFSNLLGNALTYGPPSEPVQVKAATSGGRFELSVTNKGAPIPDDIQARLFLPFVRGIQSNQKGLGLGLYIASEIAKAHGGMLGVTSSLKSTTFSFSMPLNAPGR
jgi:signal transduction histidine kinase